MHGHHPVLLEETLRLLDPRPGETAVDLTAGRGGHAEALARAVGAGGRLIGFDLDAGNLTHVRGRLADGPAVFEPVHASFVEAPRRLEADGVQADVVLADLGISSTQLDDPGRGFSFTLDAPLDMRLDVGSPVTAAAVLAGSSEEELTRIIRDFGEEPLARKIARIVVAQRGERPIQSTAQLAQLVLEAYGNRARTSRLHPATRTFMALRIAVNDELGALAGLMELIARGCESGSGWLAAGARIGIISFHSLEDRIVKRGFADLAARGLVAVLTRRPITASQEEIGRNPRSRSAKLRVARMADPDNP